MTEWTQGVGQRRLWKAEEFDGLNPNPSDWPRMAAFLDGEGHLNINPSQQRRKGQVRLLIGNTNPALPVWLRKTFGGNIVFRNSQKYNPRAKQTYIWSCTSGRAAWILYNCLPWFLLKGAQAELLIAFQEHIDQTRQGRGRTISDEAVAYRVEACKEIKRLNARGRDSQIVIPLSELTGE